jgi:alpha-glucosidase
VSPPHGWTGADPWLPWSPQPEQRNPEAMRSDPGSILQLYRRLLQVRRESVALRRGDLELLDAPDGVVAWRRASPEGDVRVVIVNFFDRSVDTPTWRGWRVEVASDGADDGAEFTGVVQPDQAVVLQPPLP